MPVEPPSLGRRGEGWVVLQSIVIVGVIVCAALGPRWPHGLEPWMRIAGWALEAVAAVMLVVSRITLGVSFTPLPRPREHSTLRSSGIYAYVRHPIYGALIVGGIGVALSRSWLVLVPTAVLAVIFWFKSLREEAWLAERYPDYAEYRRATRRRFIPWVI